MIASIRLALAAALLGALTPCALANDRATLREDAVVSSEVVRIGDLVQHSGAFADIAVFRAPDLGHTGTVEAARVIEALRRHGMDDIDARGITQIVVTRIARTVGVKEIEQRIAAALADKRGLGDAKSIDISFDRDIRELHLDAATGDLVPVRTSYEQTSGRFDVVFEAIGGQTTRRPRLRYTGIATATVEVAVLTRPLARGDVVRASDLVVERRPKASAPGGALSNIDEMIGLAARRPMTAAQMLRAADLMKPELVRQNDVVTVNYEIGGLNLTMRGKALDAGAEGETVNVMNVQTKKTMQGIVTGQGRVSLIVASPRVLTDTRAEADAAARANRSRVE